MSSTRPPRLRLNLHPDGLVEVFADGFRLDKAEEHDAALRRIVAALPRRLLDAASTPPAVNLTDEAAAKVGAAFAAAMQTAPADA